MSFDSRRESTTLGIQQEVHVSVVLHVQTHVPSLRLNPHLSPVHTGRGAPCNTRTQIIEHTAVNECSHRLQATSKGSHANLRANLLTCPVWTGPKGAGANAGKWNQLLWMGVFTQDASKRKWFMRKFACSRPVLTPRDFTRLVGHWCRLAALAKMFDKGTSGWKPSRSECKTYCTN